MDETAQTHNGSHDGEGSSERALIESARSEAVAIRRAPSAALAEDAFPGYRIVRRVRRGAQGSVYEAVDERTGERVALKVMDAIDQSPRSRSRFDAEIALLRRLRHPNIVPVLDSGEGPGGLFFTMPFVDGAPLATATLRDELGLEAALRTFSTICDAVQAAHLQGVIHRDLKPSNILIGDDGEPSVVDFGLAKLMSDSDLRIATPASLTATGQFVGSLAYASPEQFSGATGAVDVRSDVYALGVILYQIVSRGSLPHGDADRLSEWMTRVVSGDPVRPTSVASDTPRDLETIVMTCLQRDPDRRYQSAGDLARDLRRFLVGEAVDARRDSAVYMIGKLVSRHRVTAAAAGVAALALVGAIVATSLALARAVGAERAAASEAQRAEAINQFLLQDMLSSVIPDRDGRDVRVADVLDRASHRAGGAFADEPDILASVRETLGVSYLHLGLYDQAERELSSSLRVFDDASGAGALSARNQLAKLRWLQGRPGEAEEMFRESLALARSIPDPHHERTLEAMTGLAVMLRIRGETDEARELCREALERRKRIDGPDHPEVVVLESNLAMIERQAGWLETARELFASAVRRGERAIGADHPSTLIARNNLASTLMALGEHGAAEEQLRIALEGTIRTHGEAHPETAPARINLARVHLATGRPREAEQGLRRALELLRTTGAQSPIDHARIGVLIADALLDQGRPDDAMAELNDAEALLDDAGAPDRAAPVRMEIDETRRRAEQGRDGAG